MSGRNGDSGGDAHGGDGARVFVPSVQCGLHKVTCLVDPSHAHSPPHLQETERLCTSGDFPSISACSSCVAAEVVRDGMDSPVP